MPANALRLNNVAMIANSGPSFVGPLDALIANGASLYRGFSTRRLRAAFTGAPARLFGNGTGAPEEDIPFSASNVLDTAAAAALIATGGGTTGYWRTWYDQSANASNATQSTDANATHFSSAKFANGGFGGTSSQTGCWLDLPLKTFAEPFTISAVVHTTSAASRTIIGRSKSNVNRYVASNTGNGFDVSTGTVLSSTSTVSLPISLILTVVFNGASSAIYFNGLAAGSGDAGSSALDFSTSRIGSALAIGTVWAASAGNSIAELLVFDGDVTGVAGWADFITATKTHFGIS